MVPFSKKLDFKMSKISLKKKFSININKIKNKLFMSPKITEQRQFKI